MSLQDHSMAASGPTSKTDPLLEAVRACRDEKQLMQIYQAAQANLNLDINTLNLTEALMVQYKQGKMFLDDVLADDEVPANQRAQVFNSVNASIEKISKIRQNIMSQERLKLYETSMVKSLEAMKDVPGADPTMVAKLQETFFELYGEALNDRGS